jgi:hypothetical protein
MSKEVTDRFARCIEALRDNNKIRSVRQFALGLDYHPQNMSDIMRGKRDATVELLKNCIEKYKINPLYIFTGKGDMFLSPEKEDQDGCPDQGGNIVYVPRPAYAGYADQFHDVVFMEELETFTLPEYRGQRGTYRCFDVEGESMEPTLHSKDKIVCSLIDAHSYINSIKSNHVYVIVTMGDVVVKRVVNHIRQKGTIQLISDNGHFKPVELPVSEVREVWKVEVRISPFRSVQKSNPYDENSEVEELKSKLDQQSAELSKIYQVLEKLSNNSVYA